MRIVRAFQRVLPELREFEELQADIGETLSRAEGIAQDFSDKKRRDLETVVRGALEEGSMTRREAGRVVDAYNSLKEAAVEAAGHLRRASALTARVGSTAEKLDALIWDVGERTRRLPT